MLIFNTLTDGTRITLRRPKIKKKFACPQTPLDRLWAWPTATAGV